MAENWYRVMHHVPGILCVNVPLLKYVSSPLKQRGSIPEGAGGVVGGDVLIRRFEHPT